MKKADDPEMRSEYDFSGAARSPWAARLSEGQRRDLLRSAGERDAQAWLSHALERVQAMEAAVVTYLVLALNEAPETATAGAARILERAEEGRLERLLSDALQHGADPDIETRLGRVLEERNWLVHRGGYELRAGIPAPQRLAGVVSRLEGLAEDAGQLTSALEGSLRRRLSHVGWSEQEIQQGMSDVIESWLAV